MKEDDRFELATGSNGGCGGVLAGVPVLFWYLYSNSCILRVSLLTFLMGISECPLCVSSQITFLGRLLEYLFCVLLFFWIYILAFVFVKGCH